MDPHKVWRGNFKPEKTNTNAIRIWSRFFRLSPKHYFGALKLRIDELYTPNHECNHEPINLAVEKNQINEVSRAIETALKALHKNGSYSPAEILKYNELITSYTTIFGAAVNSNISSIEMPEAMRKALSENVFIFSGAKTHAQLVEASTLLLDEKGTLKARNTFLLEAREVLAKYNENYLDAEYEFAAASSQSVFNWQSIDGDRYNLQYRTAEDERVRDEHQALAGTTLPPSDAFWNSYYPPNGWRCRCVAVEVRKSKFEESNSDEAILKGEEATTQIGKTGKNKLEMFRFNPGKQQKIFPEGHPYFKVKGVAEVVKKLAAAGSTANDFVPSKIPTYEKSLDVKVNREIFDVLGEKIPVKINNKKGAYFQPAENYINLPTIGDRKKSPWKSEAVVYHEFGHAIDWKFGLKERKDVKDLMDKWRKKFSANNNRIYKDYDGKFWEQGCEAYADGKHDLTSQIGALDDTIKSLNPKYGRGHTEAYFSREGLKEAEFIAHAFENYYKGNDYWKEVNPTFYNDTRKLIKKIVTELKSK